MSWLVEAPLLLVTKYRFFNLFMQCSWLQNFLSWMRFFYFISLTIKTICNAIWFCHNNHSSLLSLVFYEMRIHIMIDKKRKLFSVIAHRFSRPKQKKNKHGGLIVNCPLSSRQWK